MRSQCAYIAHVMTERPGTMDQKARREGSLRERTGAVFTAGGGRTTQKGEGVNELSGHSQKYGAAFRGRGTKVRGA
jgi:hypothetical protein